MDGNAAEDESLQHVTERLASSLLLADEFDTDDEAAAAAPASAALDAPDAPLSMPAPLRPLGAPMTEEEKEERYRSLLDDMRREQRALFDTPAPAGDDDNDGATTGKDNFWNALVTKYRAQRLEQQQLAAKTADSEALPLEWNPFKAVKKRFMPSKAGKDRHAEAEANKASIKEKKAEFAKELADMKRDGKSAADIALRKAQQEREIAQMKAAEARRIKEDSEARKAMKAPFLGAMPPLEPLAGALPPLEPLDAPAPADADAQATPLKAQRLALCDALVKAMESPASSAALAATLTPAALQAQTGTSRDDWFHVTTALAAALAEVRTDAERALGASLAPLVAKLGAPAAPTAAAATPAPLAAALGGYAQVVARRMDSIGASALQTDLAQTLGRKLGASLLERVPAADYARAAHLLAHLVSLSHTHATNNAVPRDAEMRLRQFWATPVSAGAELHALFA